MDAGIFLRRESRSGRSRENRKLKTWREWSKPRMDSQVGRVRGREAGDSSVGDQAGSEERTECGYPGAKKGAAG